MKNSQTSKYHKYGIFIFEKLKNKLLNKKKKAKNIRSNHSSLHMTKYNFNYITIEPIQYFI